MSKLDGRYILGIMGEDMAADAVGRQSCIASLLDAGRKGLSVKRPAMLLVAVEPGFEDAAGDRIRLVLDREVEEPDGHELDPAELLRWAELYGHPEYWAKLAQDRHARVEKLKDEIRELRGEAAA